MSFSPNASLNETIELSYAEMKRSTSLKWVSVNVVLFLVFAYDLSCKCPGYTSSLHYVELALAGVLAANALLHAARLSARRPPAPRRAPAPRAPPPRARTPRPEPAHALGVARAWRPDASPPPSPPSPPSALADRRVRDEFIADSSALAAYLRAQAEPRADEPPPAWGALPPAPKPHAYQLASLDTGDGAAEQRAASASPTLWRRLHLDPERLTQWNLNLRLWIHVTILERLVREMEHVDSLLAGAGLGDVRVGLVPAERLQKAAAAVPALGALLPYLRPFADQRYAAQRYRELAHGGCLSAYRWSGGGSDWDEHKPTDAELVLHAVATYLDGQLPAAGAARPFSSAHLSAAPAPPPRSPGALAVHRLALRPPHYALALGGDTVELARGRNNLLHTLLLLLAAAARAEPPALQRLHLGPAGLNMLWIIGR